MTQTLERLESQVCILHAHGFENHVINDYELGAIGFQKEGYRRSSINRQVTVVDLQTEGIQCREARAPMPLSGPQGVKAVFALSLACKRTVRPRIGFVTIPSRGCATINLSPLLAVNLPMLCAVIPDTPRPSLLE